MLLALVCAAGCRATGPFDVELGLLDTPLPPGLRCPGLDEGTYSGFECGDAEGVCLLARPVGALEVHLELVDVPEGTVGARVPELLASACPEASSCPVDALGAPLPIACGGAPAITCILRELGDVAAMAEAVVGPATTDVTGTVMFRLVVSDASEGCDRSDGSCVLGCAYTLPVVIGSGPVSASLALDVSGGCNQLALRLCAGFGGVP